MAKMRLSDKTKEEIGNNKNLPIIKMQESLRELKQELSITKRDLHRAEEAFEISHQDNTELFLELKKEKSARKFERIVWIAVCLIFGVLLIIGV